jgi:hypothetical protein
LMVLEDVSFSCFVLFSWIELFSSID